MKWHFEELSTKQVDLEVTQQDQFQNEEVDLPETLVRETIQNSLDARPANDGRALVRFRFVSDSSLEPGFMQQLFEGHLGHATAAGVDLSGIDFNHPSALIIEDFGTVGLTGSWDDWDEGNFYYFWRCYGKTNKSGTKQGRRGLGKLVYSLSSRLRSFFGLTITTDSGVPLLMGQTVLKTRRIDGRRYPPHAYFSETKHSEPRMGLPIPTTDESFISNFRRQFSLQRANEPGLSLVIPYPNPGLHEDVMISAGILSYFIPILRGQLVLEFGDITVEAQNALDVARNYAKGGIWDVEQLFSFVNETTERMETAIQAEPGWHRGKLEDAFSQEDLKAMKDYFSNGGMVVVRFPIKIGFKSGETKDSYFLAFLKKPENLSRGQDFYVRSGINIPGESKFRERKALGMLLAEDEPVAEFLGDAENPAHTKWNGKSDKLQTKYKSPEPVLSAIRNSLIRLHDLLAQEVDEEYEDALLEFFWAPGRRSSQRRPGVKPPVVPPIILPQPQNIFRISEKAGGFSINPLGSPQAAIFPMEVKIRVAYDTVEGNPFRVYSKYDFDFSKPGDVGITARGVTISSALNNEIDCTIEGPDFEISVDGFDENRDLRVRLEA